MSNKLINGAAVLILTVWAISFILDATVTNYDPPPSVHAALLIVVTAIFTGTVIRKNGGNEQP